MFILSDGEHGYIVANPQNGSVHKFRAKMLGTMGTIECLVFAHDICCADKYCIESKLLSKILEGWEERMHRIERGDVVGYSEGLLSMRDAGLSGSDVYFSESECNYIRRLMSLK